MAVGASLLIALLAGCGGDEHEAEEESPEFGYSGPEGPSHWASLDAAYEACSAGIRQSPIGLEGGEVEPAPTIRFDYRPAALAVENNGHSVQADYPAGSSIEIAGVEYALTQFHFHAPSEHHLGDRSFALEFHFVHEAENGEIVVLGALVTEGRENRGFSELVRTIPDQQGESLVVEGAVNPLKLLPENAASAPRWSYEGSLTTPPCTEGVRWEVYERPVEMSAGQIGAYTQAYDDTNRPLQALNGRRLTVSR